MEEKNTAALKVLIGSFMLLSIGVLTIGLFVACEIWVTSATFPKLAERKNGSQVFDHVVSSMFLTFISLVGIAIICVSGVIVMAFVCIWPIAIGWFCYLALLTIAHRK